MAASLENCPICQDEFKNARLLPCIHSFCLECLEDYCRNKLPGDDMPCPVCKTDFQIPKNGVADLTVRTHNKYCQKHNKEVEIYCFDCHISVCPKCCHKSHKAHKFKRIEIVMEEFSRNIDDEMKQITSRIDTLHDSTVQFEAESCKMRRSVDVIQQEIRNKGEEVKQFFTRLIDRQVSDLLDKLQSLKSTAEKELKSQVDAVQLALTELESFRTSSLELKSKGSPSEITQPASDVSVKAKELLQKHVIPDEYHAPSYKFTPVDTDELLRKKQSFIGDVVQVKNAGPRVIKEISTDDVEVLGMTSVDDKLFMLLHRDSNQVAVYSINDYQLLRHLHLPELKKHYSNDLTSCVRHKCLYASDYNDKCIHRYDLAVTGLWSWVMRTTNKWSLRHPPRGLSVTPGGNLLVTCPCPNKLLELSADNGQCVREITLQSDILNPSHGVQLTTGQYVVCHGGSWNLDRVCIVDDDGRVTRSYGGQYGSDVGQLNWPRHMAVDEDSQFIYVADCENNRVVLLSPTLEFVRYVSEKLSAPYRLHLDHTTRRLYVAQLFGIVVVI